MAAPSLSSAQDASSSEPAPAAAAASASEPLESSRLVEDSVVKVFANRSDPDMGRPWTKQSPHDVTGSGVILQGHYIITNAHVVLYATQIEIQANKSGDKLPAKVAAIAPAIDLALLKLDDDSFFDKRPALTCSPKIPDVKDTVLTYGYPAGGSNLSITKGIISRIEFAHYTALSSGLRIQIDAAINPGNSGGAAAVGTNLIGITFSSLVGNGVQNIGYIIPCEEVDLFLEKAQHGQPYSKVALYDELQTLENPALRARLKIDKSAEGIVVHAPFGRNDPLKEWDVITRIGDKPVDNQGMVTLDSGLRILFQYLIQNQAKDGKVKLTVLRSGQTLELDVPVNDPHTMLLPDLGGGYPSYFVYGPLVFTTATQQYQAAHANQIASEIYGGSPLVARFFDTPAFPGEQLVLVASPMFPHKLARNYSNPAGQVVKSINGTPVKNLAHLVQLLRDNKDDFVEIAFAQRGAETIVLPRKDIAAATEELLNDNGIRQQGSADTMTVWNAH
jgi:S1-C subfamily serine protease